MCFNTAIAAFYAFFEPVHCTNIVSIGVFWYIHSEINLSLFFIEICGKTTLKEHFYTFKPVDSVVAQFVDYYYVHRCEAVDFRRQYRFYPHLKHAISIYKGACIEAGLHSSRISACENAGYSAIYTQVMTTPFEVEMSGPIEKIAIVFKPLGLLHFLPTTLESICKLTVNPFNPYGRQFDELMKAIFEEGCNKQELLDSFFANHIFDFEEKVVLDVASKLMDIENSQPTQEIALQFGLNRKSLLRKFKKYLCCTPEDFRKVARFRHSLTMKLKGENANSLTNIALASNYYDQSDLIRNYKKITGENPSGFLKTGTLLGDEDTFWTLLSE